MTDARLLHTALLFPLGAMQLVGLAAACRAVEPPRVLDPAWQVELVAAEPELVTPVGCCFDEAGRLLVVECHTHFPPEDYDGPQVDRIYRFDDSDGDGVLDRRQLFYEGGHATMGVASLGDGWIAVASRGQVVRIRDRDNDQVAEQRELLLTLHTEAKYPHNGLAGLALGPDGYLYVGEGENLGFAYELIAADGSKQAGGGEGGNVFRCRPDGSQLERLASGIWNPFGLCFDTADRLWVVDNDPDTMPPCRLLHVVPGGDYGFQFRFGRAGTHPLQAWNGELPGTLGMATGVGEAPCAVIAHAGALWVTSWGDNRIERYALQPDGASWVSRTQVVVQGGAMFRPAGMAAAPDGSIYFTDWVDRSYPVHGKGRLWRLRQSAGAAPPPSAIPRATPAEQRASSLREDSETSAAARLAALGDEDPFVRQAAMAGLLAHGQLAAIDRGQSRAPLQRVGLLSAWRWQELVRPDEVRPDDRNGWITWGLQDTSDDVVLAAMRWATERDCKGQLPHIRGLLDRPDLSATLFTAAVASIAYLETGSAAGGARDPARESLLYEFAADSGRSPKLRSLAIRMLPAVTDKPGDDELHGWLQAHDADMGMEIVRLLTARGGESALSILANIANNPALSTATRADAVAGLARNAGQYAAVLRQLALPRQPDEVRQEARRVLQRGWQDERSTRPAVSDLDAWDGRVGRGGDPAAGRRVFFRSTCCNCHAHSGRGASTGPDLTTLAGQMTSRRLLESILEPSKEVGPRYVPWRVVTVDGKVLTGLKLDAAGVGDQLRFQGADGITFEIPLGEIETQEVISTSIMPAGLQDSLSLEELRDLIAFLLDPAAE